MRPIKVTYNSTINSTAFVVECRYHNISEPALIIVGKKEEESIPTNVAELFYFATNRVLSSPSILNKDSARVAADSLHFDQEEYSWRL